MDAQTSSSSVSAGLLIFIMVGVILGVIGIAYASRGSAPSKKSSKKSSEASAHSSGGGSIKPKWNRLPNTRRGVVDDAGVIKPMEEDVRGQPRKNTLDQCADWCKNTQDGVYFNYNENDQSCVCIPKSVGFGETNHLTQCITPEEGSWTGPVGPTFPHALCPPGWNVSTCHNASELGGWPSEQRAKMISSETGVPYSSTCVKKCEKDGKHEAEAAVFQKKQSGETECRCYGDWTVAQWNDDVNDPRAAAMTACFGEAFADIEDRDAYYDLWSRSGMTGCRAGEYNLPKCPRR